MTKEEYINYPAVSASRIKRFYLGDVAINPSVKAALDKGAAFHHQLLETEPVDMSEDAYNVYNAICSNPMLEALFINSSKEMIVVDEIVIPKQDGGQFNVIAKGMLDMVYEADKIIVDVKTTQCKTIQEFASDMISHCNHIQAVWYCLLMNYSISNFYYIGVPSRAKKKGSTSSDLFLYRHNEQELESALMLISKFLNEFNGDYSK